MKNYLLFFFLVACAAPAFAQFGMTKDQWRTDLTVLRDELPKRHPNFYAFQKKIDYDRDLDALMNSLEGKTDLQIAMEAQAILARSRDASTRLDLSKVLHRERVIPVGFGWYADGLFISGTIRLFAPLLGAKVVSINGLPVEEALRRVGRFTANEHADTWRRDAVNWLRFPAVYRLAGLGNSDTLQVVLEDANGRRGIQPLYSIDVKTTDPNLMRPVQVARAQPDVRWRPATALYYYNWLEQDSIVYFQYNQCHSQEMALAAGDSALASRLPPFQIYVDSLFALLDRTPHARLFFDIRFNPGGLSAADGRMLADRLAQLPWLNKPDRLFVAMNAYTALAAVEVVDYFDKRTNATILGEAPAQLAEHYGMTKTLKLPNSAIDVVYSTQFPGLKGHANRAPDVPIGLTFKEFQVGKDPVLDYVRGLK